MRFDAIKHPGYKRGGSSLEVIGKETGLHSKSVQRFIQLSNLSDALLEKIDSKRIEFLTGELADIKAMLSGILEHGTKTE